MPRLWLFVPAVLVLFVTAGVGGYFLLRPSPPTPAARPEPQPGNTVPAAAPGADPKPAAGAGAGEQSKLVVLFVFDQMRGDYMTKWAELYGADGFERFKKEGVWFADCQVPYACASTGPGHASLSTGAPPSVHGIIENEWHDRKTNQRTYCCQPTRPYELVPPLPANAEKPSRGSADGYSPERLLSPTVADALHDATGGKGKAFTLSIKDRTAVLMGGQTPTGAYCFDTRDGRFHTGAWYGRTREGFAEHPWVKEFNESKLADTWFDTKWERLPSVKLADYDRLAGPDDALGEADGFNGQGHTFPHSLKGKLDKPAKKYYDALEGSPYGNELLVSLAKKAVTAEKLGKGAAPDLLCVSFSSNDLLGHRWGPDSHEMMDVTLRADKMVGEFVKFLDDTVGKGKWTMVIAADHGVCPLPERKAFPAAERVMADSIVAGLGQALDAMYGTKGGWFEAFDGDVWPWLYLNHATLKERNLDPEAVAKVAADWLAGRGYLEAAYTRKQLEDGQFPADQPFKKMAALAYRADRCGDVIAIPKAGVLVTTYKGGTSHGTPQPYDTHIPFLALGAGVPALGKRTEKVSSLSVAPTLAWALGVPAPKDAAVLPPEALTKK